MTADELLLLPDDGKFYELLDGVLVEMSPPGARHGGVTSSVSYFLTAHVRGSNLGVVLVGDPGIVLHRNPDRVRAPDVCFISQERIPAGGIPTGYLEIVPDLVVEVVSPGDTASEVEQKIEERLRSGAPLVWAVYPATRSVVAHNGFESAHVYTEDQTLDGGNVLPGFTVKVADFFS